jgi:hypothetical protein
MLLGVYPSQMEPVMAVVAVVAVANLTRCLPLCSLAAIEEKEK